MPEGKRNETLEANIGIVGTEAKINQKKLLKSRREIWSLPIAVLALVLMLAGALVVSGVVQAQSTKEGKRAFLFTSSDVTDVISDFNQNTDANKEKLTVYFDPNQDGFAATSSLGTITVSTSAVDHDEDDTTTPRPGLASGETVSEPHAQPGEAGSIDGYELTGADADMFNIGPTGVITVDAEELADVQAYNKKAEFSFNVRIYVDTDELDDSGKGVGVPADTSANQTEADTPRGADLADDRDEVETLSVKVYAIKVDTESFSFATTTTAVSDAPLMGLNDEGEGYSHGIEVLGLPTRATDVRSGEASPTDWTIEVDSARVARVKHESGPDVQNKVVNTIQPYAASLVVDIDGDPGLDDADAATGETPDDRITLPIPSTIKIYDELEFVLAKLDDSATLQVNEEDPEAPHEFSVQSNASKGTIIGEIDLNGTFPNLPAGALGGTEADESEEIDVIVSGSSKFSVRTRMSDGATGGDRVVAAVIMVNSDDGLEMSESPFEFSITANGRLGSTRTTSTKAKVRITASNETPVVDPSALTDGEVVLTIEEDDKSTDSIIEAMVGEDDDRDYNVVYDFSDIVTDDNDLTYEVVSGSAMFKIKPDTSLLVPSEDIVVGVVLPDEDEGVKSPDVV